MPDLRLGSVFCLLTVWLLSSCSPAGPQARQGALGLTERDFDCGGLANLDGEWNVVWGQRLNEFPPGAGTPSTKVPGMWDANLKNQPAGHGAATYHLRLTLPHADRWALFIPEISCAWSLSVNGVLVETLGVPSVLPSEYRPSVQALMVTLPEGSVYDLVLAVVNFDDPAGGIRDHLLVGSTRALAQHMNRIKFDSGVLVGAIALIALLNFVLFFLGPKRQPNLWLALFSAVMAVRTILTGSRIVYDFWPGLTYEVLSQMEYLCLFAAVGSSTIYFKHVLQRWWPARVFVPFLLYTALFALLAFLLPGRVYSDAFTAFYLFPLVMATVILMGVSFWAMAKRHEDGLWLFSGFLFLFFGSINDIALQFLWLPEGHLLEPSVLLFLGFHTFILNRRVLRDFALSQRQSGELKKLDRMKDDFLARVSHELLTPLHGIIGILDAFKVGDFGALPPRQQYHLGLIESSSKRLLAMVQSILDFGRLKKHPSAVELQPVVLKETVDFLLPSFYPAIGPGVALVNHLEEELPAALADQVRLEQVFHHLLRNAVQHTTSGTILIEAEVKDQQILVSIRDTGRGIPAERVAQVFTPFHQVTDVDTRETGGLGLGLSISRELVRLMGGRLDLQSQEGKGTTVILTLAVCPPGRLQYFQAQRLDRAFHAADVVGRPSDPTMAPASNREAGGPAILIVDDEPANRLVLRTFLAGTGYQVLEATSGAEALVLVETRVIDLAILDIMMPGMSGYELCRRIRERFTAARLPVVFLTAKNQVEDLLQGYRAGANDFLTKPFHRDELKVRVELHLGVSRAARTGMVVANRG